MERILLKILILSFVNFFASCDTGTETSTNLQFIDIPRPSTETRIYDNANLIQQKKSLDTHLKTLYTLANIDMVVVTIPTLHGNNIDDIANRLLSNWKIGENTNGKKGVLFLISVEEELVRFEIGYDLEWIYPDSFVGYVERDQMSPFFETGRIQDGIAATLEMIIARANEEIDKQSYNPEDKLGNVSDDYYSGGAGAKKKIQIKTVSIPDKPNYPEDIKSFFVPQPTPEEAYLLNIEKCRRHIRGYDFDLYTDETREISKTWVFTNAQMDNEVRDTSGKSFKVFTNGDLSIIVFDPKYRNCPPVYLIKNDNGWQLDMATMSKTIHFDMRNRAHIEKSRYTPLFMENGYSFDANNFLYYKGE